MREMVERSSRAQQDRTARDLREFIPPRSELATNCSQLSRMRVTKVVITLPRQATTLVADPGTRRALQYEPLMKLKVKKGAAIKLTRLRQLKATEWLLHVEVGGLVMDRWSKVMQGRYSQSPS